MANNIHESDKFGTIDVSTLRGIQTALSFLGYDPGEIDGLEGPNTKNAIKAFQEGVGLKADGIVGKDTRQAMMDALEEGAEAEDDEDAEADPNA